MPGEISTQTQLQQFLFNEQGPQAIILAGGLGTRLRNTVPDLPKCMAPVAGRPFLFYVINYLRGEGVKSFIFSLGYLHEVIEEYLDNHFPTLKYECSVEKEPLGTGGAIKLACEKATEKTVLIVNGDTLFKIQLSKLIATHHEKNADCTLSLKEMKNFDRYGVVELNSDSSIKCFKEKKFYERGYINGGVYALDVPAFLKKDLPEKFSFEKDYLEKSYASARMFGVLQNEYFIDIGIPEDYERAQSELQRQTLELKNIGKSWTIFLDRDGVINHEKYMEYVLNWKGFTFYDNVAEAIKILTQKFGKVFIVSNQRGVGRELMTMADLEDIHHRMRQELERNGGHIQKIYYCTSVDMKHFERKPNPGMAFRAKKDFPEIDLSKSIMVGNKPSDMLFGRNAGMFTVYLTTTDPDQVYPHPDIDLVFPTLLDFAKTL